VRGACEQEHRVPGRLVVWDQPQTPLAVAARRVAGRHSVMVREQSVRPLSPMALRLGGGAAPECDLGLGPGPGDLWVLLGQGLEVHPEVWRGESLHPDDEYRISESMALSASVQHVLACCGPLRVLNPPRRGGPRVPWSSAIPRSSAGCCAPPDSSWYRSAWGTPWHAEPAAGGRLQTILVSIFRDRVRGVGPTACPTCPRGS